ncbi:MAG TPA: cold shock domain-containing protein [Gaiellaceae bacterium]|nr:cold shock domain-containing protein [Gaiellaceae bacterium]
MAKPYITGTVAEWRDDEGWGVVSSPDLPGLIWVHFSHVDMEGFVTLSVGQEVQLRAEDLAPYDQDGYRFRALIVRP